MFDIRVLGLGRTGVTLSFDTRNPLVLCHTGVGMTRLLALAILLETSSIILASEYGPAVGTIMPSFEATDQNGRLLTLKDVLRPNGAAIVFFRSADW